MSGIRLLLCTDLDRTLIPNGAQSESPGARERLAALVAHKDILLAYVSGRDQALVEEAMAEYRLPRPDFVIGDVGTTIYDLRTGSWQRWDVWEKEIDPDWNGLSRKQLQALLADVHELTLQEPAKQNRQKLSYYVSLQVAPGPLLEEMAQFLAAAEYTLEEGPANEWFASSEVTMWALVSVAGALLFFYRAFRAQTPIVDLQPFTSPTFAVGAGLGFILGLGLFSSVYLTPLFLSSVRGYSALQIGHTMFVQGAVMFLTAPIIGRLARALPDTRLLGFSGFILVALSCWMQANLTAEAGFYELMWPQVLRALGLMSTFSSTMEVLIPPILKTTLPWGGIVPYRRHFSP